MKILILLTFITTNSWISLNDETIVITDNKSMGIITDQPMPIEKDQKFGTTKDRPISLYDKYKKIIWVVGVVSSAILGIWGLSKLMGVNKLKNPMILNPLKN
jgi:hypothetical protein